MAGAIAALLVVGGTVFALTRGGDDEADEPAEQTSPADDTVAGVTLPDVTVPTERLPAPTEEPSGLGDDEELDALAADCYAGALISCDELYAISPVDSDYETYGDTCAGRQERQSNQFCSAMVDFPSPGLAPSDLPDDDREVALLASRCWAGNMGACDDMAAQAAAGSEGAAFGASCAGRREDEAGTPCTEAFAEWEAYSG